MVLSQVDIGGGACGGFEEGNYRGQVFGFRTLVEV